MQVVQIVNNKLFCCCCCIVVVVASILCFTFWWHHFPVFAFHSVLAVVPVSWQYVLSSLLFDLFHPFINNVSRGNLYSFFYKLQIKFYFNKNFAKLLKSHSLCIQWALSFSWCGIGPGPRGIKPQKGKWMLKVQYSIFILISLDQQPLTIH